MNSHSSALSSKVRFVNHCTIILQNIREQYLNLRCILPTLQGDTAVIEIFIFFTHLCNYCQHK